MNDLTTLSARPRVLRVGDEAHDVHPFTFDDFADLQAWVDSQFPDPFDLATKAIDAGRLVVRDGKPAREPYPVAQQQHLIKVALEQSSRGRRLIGTPEADEKAQSLDGVKEILYLSIRKGNPDFTRGDAARLYKHMTYGHVARLYQDTEVARVLTDPKAGPGPATPGGTTTA